MNDATRIAKLAAAQNGDQQAFDEFIEPYRRELLGYCYRLLGSFQDAEDLVQEVFLRAWLKLNTFEKRGSFRAWLYKIATNACLNALTRSPARSLPIAITSPADVNAPVAPPGSESTWLEPFPDELLADASTTPEAAYSMQESVTLAFLVARGNWYLLCFHHLQRGRKRAERSDETEPIARRSQSLPYVLIR